MSVETFSDEKSRQIRRLETFETLVKEEPRKKHFVPLAQLYVSLGYVDQAIETLKKGLVFHPSYYIARALLADLYFKIGHLIQARLEAKRVMDQDPLNLLAKKIFAKASKRLGQPAEAAALMETVPSRIGDFKIERLGAKYKSIDVLNQLLVKIQARSREV